MINANSKPYLSLGLISGGIIGVGVGILALRLNHVPLDFTNIALYMFYHVILYATAGLIIGWLVSGLLSLLFRTVGAIDRRVLISGCAAIVCFVLFRMMWLHPVQMAETALTFEARAERGSVNGEDSKLNTFSDSVATQPHKNVLIFALDAATFSIIDTLVAAGKLPTFEKLMQNGVRAPFKTMEPTRSPVLWTSIATSKMPQEHGIWDFVLSKMPGTSFTRGRFKYPDGSGLQNLSGFLSDISFIRNVPYTSNLRKTRAFWNILSDYGREVGVIGWYTSFPAEPVNGFLVSDGLFFTTQEDKAAGDGLLTFPPELNEVIEDSLLDYTTVSDERLISIFELKPRTWGLMQKSQYFENMSYLLRETYTKDENTFRVAKMLLKEFGVDDPDVTAVYFKALDEVSHAACEENMDELLSDKENDSICWDNIKTAYQHTDEWMIEIMKLIDEETITMVISDHGFSYGDLSGESQVGHWEAQDGIFILSGPDIRNNREIPPVTLMDFLPTLLYIQNLPVAEDLQGEVVRAAFEEEFLAANPVSYIPTYEYAREQSEQPVESEFNKEIEKKLKSLGYLK